MRVWQWFEWNDKNRFAILSLLQCTLNLNCHVLVDHASQTAYLAKYFLTTSRPDRRARRNIMASYRLQAQTMETDKIGVWINCVDIV